MEFKEYCNDALEKVRKALDKERMWDERISSIWPPAIIFEGEYTELADAHVERKKAKQEYDKAMENYAECQQKFDEIKEK